MAASDDLVGLQQVGAMFPHLDLALIEDVLRANKWNIESSIDFLLPESHYTNIPEDAVAMIDSQNDRASNLSSIDEEGISLAWEAADLPASVVGFSFGSSDDIPLEYSSEERQPELPTDYSENSVAAPLSETFDVMSAMRAKALSLLQVNDDKEKNAQLAVQEQQRQKRAEDAARQAAKAAKKWPMIKHLYSLLGDFASLPEDMAIAIFRNLGAADLSAICQVSKQANIYFNSGFWWRILVFTRFGKWDGHHLWWGRTADLQHMSWKKIYLKLHTSSRAGSITHLFGGSSTMWIVRGNELRRIGGSPALFTLNQSQHGHRPGLMARSIPPPFTSFSWDGKSLIGGANVRIMWNKEKNEFVTINGLSFERAVLTEAPAEAQSSFAVDKQNRDEAISAATIHGLHPKALQWSEVSNGHPKADNSGLQWKNKTRFVKLQSHGVDLFRISGDVPVPFIIAAVFRLDNK
eukprot:TRINITY_DN2128_c0_g1_i1.p1 TRINITY_DN2128_c0_g1~~TRINITY_DN2128_c0_g1_i1.p1  ORF type:complete len:474 (+),score=62.64 TRINITY_DN2128_c0_g1_i1:31-1422(+)